jgi:hypothetical protein
MHTEAISMGHAGQKRIERRHLVALFVALVFASMTYPNQAHAQIVGNLEANIPFQFHAGNAKFPAGKYVIHMFDDSDLTVMEISSADGTTTALFQVHAAEANSAPGRSELIFKKYGDRYFLEKLFDEGNLSGSQVVESAYEKRIGRAAAEATEEHVPAHRLVQKGN